MTVDDLLTAGAVRAAAQRMLADGLDGRLLHWTVDLARLDAVADRVAAVTRAAYPDLVVPFHARWRHFEVGGRDRWQALRAEANWPDRVAEARAAFDLAIVSVLLDAGSGGRWVWREPETGLAYRSSEGLGLASLALVAEGSLSSCPAETLRADADGLQALDRATLERVFQVGADNPLAGVEGRLALLNRLGAVCAARPDLFGRADDARPGGLVDVLIARSQAGAIAAPAILALVLEALGPIWPSRLVLDGRALGDAWIYPPWADGAAPGPSTVVPLHKLLQWLTYSLIEPLMAMGLSVTDIDGLTGLAEYRNGGLLIDAGVLQLKAPAEAAAMHPVAAPLIVEWRALTVALLDRLHPLVGARLGLGPDRFPLACLLEGGSWAAGRAIAREMRADGGPPLKTESDGTTF